MILLFFLVFKTWSHSLSMLTSNSQQSSCLTKQAMHVKVLTNMFGQLFFENDVCVHENT